jgi:dolichol-phosphate mannosyltransferase
MKLSIVIPAFNEADNIQTTLEEVLNQISSIEAIATYEIIIVDDHSSDNTFTIIKGLNKKNIRSIRLSRRSGSHIAIKAGLDIAHGDAVLCISADGQDNPSAIPAMIAQWLEGIDIVWALRKNRNKEPLLIKLFAKTFYALLKKFGEISTEIDLSRADFYLLDKKVVDAIKSCGERNTSLFGLIVWLGFSQNSIEYERRERRSGQSKWNFKSRMLLAKNWIIAFSGLPLKFMTYTGFFVAIIGFCYALFIIMRNLLYGSPISGWPSVFTAILILGGGQFVMLGLIGEYLWRTLDESRDRPNYFVEGDTSQN